MKNTFAEVSRISIVLACLMMAGCGDTGTAQSVSIRHDLADPSSTLFPSDRFTVADSTQNTLRRVDLPKPDCAAQPSECDEIDIINQLDGFSLRPRITLSLTGEIDPASVGSASIFLQTTDSARQIGIGNVVWDAATRTLAFEPAEQLLEQTRYLLIVTDAVRDTRGRALVPAVALPDPTPQSSHYLRQLQQALRESGIRPARVAAASLFTTQSVSADLVKIRNAIKQATPETVDFMIANWGTQRALFEAAASQVAWQRQTGVAPLAFSSTALPMAALTLVPGAVGRIAYGKFVAPLYLNAALEIPASGTRTGEPRQLGTHEVIFQLFMPAGTPPPAGWAVVVIGHGASDSMYGAPWLLASVLASQGIASVAINAVGHGGGPASSLVVRREGAPVITIPAGGRGVDQDGDGTIGRAEGVRTLGANAVVFYRDTVRQTVIDLMQLVRQVQAGVDVEGDGVPDLDPDHIYFLGQSLGGIYGTVLLGVDPDLAAGALNVTGGSFIDVMRTGADRGLLGAYLARRTPSLINVSGTEFDERLPAPGALRIQQALDRLEWVQQSASPLAWAPYLYLRPLPGARPKPVLVQFARGDLAVANATTLALVETGGLAAWTTEYRHDLARAANPALPANPHPFMVRIDNPEAAPIAVAAQRQIATFFASGGAIVLDPDGSGPIWEITATGPDKR